MKLPKIKPPIIHTRYSAETTPMPVVGYPNQAIGEIDGVWVLLSSDYKHLNLIEKINELNKLNKIGENYEII